MFDRTRWTLGVVSALWWTLSFATPVHAGWTPSLGVEEGASLGNVGDSRPVGVDLRGEWTFGTGAGIVAAWSPAPAWSLEFAPGWERVRRKVTIDFGYDSELVREFDRIPFPVRLLRRVGRSAWSIEGGGGAAWTARVRERTGFGFLLNAPFPSSVAAARSLEPDASIFEQIGKTETVRDATDSYHRWDAFVSGGIGWEHAVGGPKLRLRARWQQGLTRVNKYGGTDIRLSGFAATAGLQW